MVHGHTWIRIKLLAPLKSPEHGLSNDAHVLILILHFDARSGGVTNSPTGSHPISPVDTTTVVFVRTSSVDPRGGSRARRVLRTARHSSQLRAMFFLAWTRCPRLFVWGTSPPPPPESEALVQIVKVGDGGDMSTACCKLVIVDYQRKWERRRGDILALLSWWRRGASSTTTRRCFPLLQKAVEKLINPMMRWNFSLFAGPFAQELGLELRYLGDVGVCWAHGMV